MGNPLVSILIPAYNVEKYLPQCLDSILSQTYRLLQIVIIDDGSKDNTLAVCYSYADKDSRVEVYHQENQGVATTRNHLLEKVKGDWALFVDADDWIESDMVEFLVNKADQRDVDVVTCKDVKNEKIVTAGYFEEVFDKERMIKEFLCHNILRGSLWNKLIRRGLLDGNRFQVGISYGEDALFCWAVFQKVNRMLFTDRELYHYRMNDTSLSHSVFGPNKLSGHLTWKTICSETKKLWPQYLSIAKARWAIEDIQLVRAAAHDNYPYNDEIKELQNTVISNYSDIVKTKISTTKMMLYAFFASRSYKFASWF